MPDVCVIPSGQDVRNARVQRVAFGVAWCFHYQNKSWLLDVVFASPTQEAFQRADFFVFFAVQLECRAPRLTITSNRNAGMLECKVRSRTRWESPSSRRSGYTARWPDRWSPNFWTVIAPWPSISQYASQPRGNRHCVLWSPLRMSGKCPVQLTKKKHAARAKSAGFFRLLLFIHLEQDLDLNQISPARRSPRLAACHPRRLPDQLGVSRTASPPAGALLDRNG